VTARLEVVLVRPKEDGNVGAVARVARNFGAGQLVLVQPRARLGVTARRRAMGGLALLKQARRAATFEEAVRGADLVVGTSDVAEGRSRAFLRRSISPERLGELVRTVEGTIALVFGPEDNGLGRSELARCDLMVHVPARREFPTLNLSHAAGVILYAIHRARGQESEDSTPAPERLELKGREKELFLERAAELLNRTGYPSHKRKGMVLLLRRVLGRATPTEAECRMLLGFLRQMDYALSKRRDGRNA
jgi:tRNA/rRNA methyltransferase